MRLRGRSASLVVANEGIRLSGCARQSEAGTARPSIQDAVTTVRLPDTLTHRHGAANAPQQTSRRMSKRHGIPGQRHVVRVLVAMLLAAMAVVGFANAAAADIALVSTSPGDGSTKNKPVANVSLKFDRTASPEGPGIEIFDSTGTLVPSTTAASNGGTTLTATPAQVLSDGDYGVLWKVVAADNHSLRGKFSFAVEPAASTNAVPTPPTSDPDDPLALQNALAESETASAEWVRWIGLFIATVGTVVGVGGLIFLGLAMIGRQAESGALARLVRWAAIAAIAGTVLQLAARSTIRQDGDWSAGINPESLRDILSSDYGWSISLRIVGSLLLLFIVIRPRLVTTAATESAPEDPVWAIRRLPCSAAALGAVLIVVSYMFDGHTATAEPLWLIRVSDAAHVIAAATWVGGVFALARVFAYRARRSLPVQPALLTVRFSVLATVALILVMVTGVIQAIMVLDSIGQLTGSTWGRVLLIKTAVVAVLAILGGYNQFRLVPALKSQLTSATRELESASDQYARSLRLTLSVEAGLFIVVIALTALLVNSSPLR
jgi:copper transport protein